MDEPKNVRPDFSKAGADSALYRTEDPKTEKEKLKELHGKAKLWYLFHYYGLQTAIIAAVVAFVSYMIFYYATKKDTVLSIMAVNADWLTDSGADDASYYTGFLEQNGIDPDKNEVVISDSLGASADADDTTSVENIQMIQSRFLTQSVDVFFSDEEFFVSLGEFDYFADVTEYLTDEQLTRYADDLVEVTSVETGETYTIGIRLHENEWISSTGWYETTCVVGLAAGLEHEALAVTFLNQEILEE